MRRTAPQPLGRWRSRRGAALVIVTLLMVMLIALGTEFIYSTRVDLKILDATLNRQRARYLARAGLDAGMAVLLYDLEEDKEQRGELGGKVYDATKGAEGIASGMDELWSLVEFFPLPVPGVPDGVVNIKIEDEQGKININLLTDKLGVQEFSGAFNEFWPILHNCPEGDPVCVPPDENLTQQLVAWVNPDEEFDIDADYYRSLEPEGYEARRGPMATLSELRIVNGFLPAMFEAFAPYLTVYPRIGLDTKLHQYGQKGGRRLPNQNRNQPGGANDPNSPGDPNDPNDPNNRPAVVNDCASPPADVKSWRLLNVNSASYEALAAYIPGLDPAVFQEEILPRRYGYGPNEGPFTDVNEFLSLVTDANPDAEVARTTVCKYLELLTTESSYFKIVSTGIYNEIVYTQEAVVHRDRQKETVEILYQRDL